MDLDGEAKPSLLVKTEPKDASSGKGGFLGIEGEPLWQNLVASLPTQIMWYRLVRLYCVRCQVYEGFPRKNLVVVRLKVEFTGAGQHPRGQLWGK